MLALGLVVWQAALSNHGKELSGVTRVSVSEAAKLTGKSRETINKATQSGKLSFTRGENKRKEIDVAELERVYKLRRTLDDLHDTKADVKRRQGSSASDAEALSARLEGAERLLETIQGERDRERRQLEAEIETLRSSLEKMQDQHGRALLLITDQSGRRHEDSYEWKRAVRELRERVSNQEREFERTKRHALKLEKQLQTERARSWFDRLLKG